MWFTTLMSAGGGGGGDEGGGLLVLPFDPVDLSVNIPLQAIIETAVAITTAIKPFLIFDISGVQQLR